MWTKFSDSNFTRGWQGTWSVLYPLSRCPARSCAIRCGCRGLCQVPQVLRLYGVGCGERLMKTTAALRLRQPVHAWVAQCKPFPSRIPRTTFQCTAQPRRCLADSVKRHVENRGSVSLSSAATDWQSHRSSLERLLRRHLFYMPSFEIYQGSSSIDTKGLYDYGPLGCALQRNVVDLWRAHFILEEDMLEIESPSITPHEVLEASGHVDKFLDWVSRDAHTGQVHRSDHLVKHTLQRRLKADATARRREHGRDSGKEELGNTQPKARKSEEEILSEDTRRVYQETVAKVCGILAYLYQWRLRSFTCSA